MNDGRPAARFPLDLSEPLAIHVIGIGGAGMSAIAEILHVMGHTVSGSDLAGGRAVDRLLGLGVQITIGHDASNIGSAAVVARSTAIPDGNVEVKAVLAAGGRVLRRAEILAAICSQRRTVAVTGTHGKTTTSAMLAVITMEAGLDPSFVVGAEFAGLGTGARWGAGEWLIVEADESDGSFIELGHSMGIVTNVEPDHIEHYGGEAAMREAFAKFVDIAETAIVCADDAGSMAFAHLGNVVSYGQSDSADYRMSTIERGPSSVSFEMRHEANVLGRITVPMPGMHNALNAGGAVAAALEMGISFDEARRALAGFGGLSRRFQARGSAGGIDFVDDYAHLPTEVAAALSAARDTSPQRLVAVFQPHRYSRTEALWQDFTGAFDQADLLIVTGIYAAGEKARHGVSGSLIVDAVERGSTAPETLYIEERRELAARVLPRLRHGDLCLTLGAGDLVGLPDELLTMLQTVA